VGRVVFIDELDGLPAIAIAGIWTLLLFAVIIEQGQGSAFIYFAF